MTRPQACLYGLVGGHDEFSTVLLGVISGPFIYPPAENWEVNGDVLPFSNGGMRWNYGEW